MDRPKLKSRVRRIQRVVWITMGSAMLGYFAVTLLRDARYATAVAACAIVPIGATAPTPLKGALRGAGLGLLAGVGIYVGLTQNQTLQPEILRQIVLKAVGGTTVLCAAVGAVFALLAKARRERSEREWRQ